jgi:hypothetical protein
MQSPWIRPASSKVFSSIGMPPASPIFLAG